ncbi:hypothetical protein JB92DRAFT_2838092 [Gautieria morchelliformis]|nr:hypothetical protein JB92DRAFT_2838092 [Gautieria morchelliformis]
MHTIIQALGGLVAVAALTPTVRGNVDYLIVGGGTAGLVLANRLTENPKVSVLVLEAGGDGLGNQNISDIGLIGAADGTQIDWQFHPAPLAFANNRSLGNAPRGKVLGGSSAINGDVFDRGDAREYDDWETLGNPGWNSESILTAGMKAERFFAPNASENIDFVLEEHGLYGNLATSYSNPAPPLHDTIISSVANAGGINTPDNDGGYVDGISHVTNARLPFNSTRATSATGYYFPFSSRSNFQVTLFVTVNKIVWKSTHAGNAVAAGVEYVDQKGVSHTVNATNVILSSGTWGSPAILERSGVGNATLLSSLGINSVIDLPGVGENLQERYLLETLAAMTFSINSSLPLNPVQPFLLNMESLQKTVGAENLTTVEALLDVKPPGLSDAQFNSNKRLYSQQVPWVEGYIALSTPPTGGSVLTWFGVNLHQQSRGSVHIVSTDVAILPEVQFNLLQSPLDTYVMAAAAKRIQQIVATPPLSDWIAGPISPPAGVTTIPDLEAYIRANVNIANHIIGTALMAPRNDGGVVDPYLKVYGTKNVYVVDASVIPVEPAAHLQGTVYALAERAAQLFKQSS